MDTLELNISLNPVNPWREILIAELAENGFDGFMESETGLLAYAESTIDVNQIISESCLAQNDEVMYEIKQTIIPQQNWNAEWESNFQPVYVEDYATILAPFHDTSESVGMEVIIQPQMSFGTGHHQTTWMMTKALFELDSMPKDVLDMGTGTGVLAIVAEKLGAKNILGIDIEDWSVENAIENAERNGCHSIEMKCGDVDLIEGMSFDLILANINKNILKRHLEQYSVTLQKNGVLLLSGFFGADVDEMTNYASAYSLSLVKVYEKDEWAALQFVKQ